MKSSPIINRKNNITWNGFYGSRGFGSGVCKEKFTKRQIDEVNLLPGGYRISQMVYVPGEIDVVGIVHDHYVTVQEAKDRYILVYQKKTGQSVQEVVKHYSLSEINSLNQGEIKYQIQTFPLRYPRGRDHGELQVKVV